MNSQQRPRLNSRPALPRIPSGPQMPPPPEIHFIVRLPYNRPPDAPAPPPQVVWSAEKERILWNELSRSWTNLNAINWAGLSTQLDVPVPYLLHRAQAKYEEDLRGLQGIRQGPLSAAPLLSPTITSPSDERSSGYSAQRMIAGRANFPQSNPLSPSSSTPTSAPLRRLSSSGPAGSRLSRGSNGSVHTIIQPTTSAPTTTRMPKLNPVLTPLRTATGSRPSTPSSGRSTPSGTDSEGEREAKAEAQREEADQLALKLKDLQKMMGSNTFGFARARPRPLESSTAPSMVASQTRSQSATLSFTQARRSLKTPTGAAMTADTSEASTSTSGSAQDSIPDLPSPASDSRARLPVRVTRRATSASTHRSPSVVSEVPERGPLGRTRAQEAGSGQVSSASSFSDLSDMSASALEDALMSNNFKSTTAASRMSMFSRVQHSRGQPNARHGRYP
ncbi:hypothetical protein BDV93DRAFT_606769 [Ceratobasidium sp. AG-I]|nr:hypothetical protein BDV93DRAFT_606769 [Ceratobasidium sp. AG-I]